MVNAQEYLDKKYPKNGVYQWGITNLHNLGKERTEVKKIDIWVTKNLEGSLKLEGFTSLEDFNCRGNSLTELDLSGAPNLKKINCSSNNLRKLTLGNLENLIELDCSNNQLTELDINNYSNLEKLACGDNKLDTLSIFSHLVNLKELKVGNCDEKKIQQGIYNQLSGSLKPLKNLRKLSYLDISNTDIDSGMEYLSDDLKWVFFTINLAGKNWKVKKMQEQFEDNKNLNYPKWRRKNTYLIKTVEKYDEEMVKLSQELEDKNKLVENLGEKERQIDRLRSLINDLHKQLEKKQSKYSQETLSKEEERFWELEKQSEKKNEIELKEHWKNDKESRENELKTEEEDLKKKIKDKQAEINETGTNDKEKLERLQKDKEELEERLTKKQEELEKLRKSFSVYIELDDSIKEKSEQLKKLAEDNKLKEEGLIIDSEDWKKMVKVQNEIDQAKKQMENIIKNPDESKISQSYLDKKFGNFKEKLKLVLGQLDYLNYLIDKIEKFNYLIEKFEEFLPSSMSYMIPSKIEINESKKSLMSAIISLRETIDTKEKVIIELTNDFLEAKNNFLVARKETTIEKLQKCHDKLAVSGKRYATGEAVGKVVSEMNISWVPGGTVVTKTIGGLIRGGVSFFSWKANEKRNEQFQNLLIDDKNGLLRLNNAYNYLVHVIRNNEDLPISSSVINILRLEDKLELESERIRLFDNKYEVFDILIEAEIWEGKKLDLERMNAAIKELGINLRELEKELDQEKGKFRKELKSIEVQKTQIQIPPK